MTQQGTQTGEVKWFSHEKGYGFIKPDAGNGKDDVFVHVTALTKAGINNLNEGQRIEYELVESKGKVSADNLKLI